MLFRSCFNFHRVEPKIIPFLSGMVHLQQLSPRALLPPFELTLASLVGTTLDDGIIKFLGCLCPQGYNSDFALHLYMTTGKTIALTIRTFVGKVMSLLLNMLSRLVIQAEPQIAESPMDSPAFSDHQL